MDYPLITISQNVYLRLFDESDVSSLHQIVVSEKERLYDWLNSLSPLETKNDVHRFIKQNTKNFHNLYDSEAKGSLHGIQFGIFSEDTQVGMVGYQAVHRTHNMASVGYWIRENAEGRGLVLKSCEAMIDWGFQHLQLNRIEIQAAVDNTRSIAVAERLNFSKEALLRQVEKRNHAYIDHVLYRMLHSDWKVLKRNTNG